MRNGADCSFPSQNLHNPHLASIHAQFNNSIHRKDVGLSDKRIARARCPMKLFPFHELSPNSIGIDKCVYFRDRNEYIPLLILLPPLSAMVWGKTFIEAQFRAKIHTTHLCCTEPIQKSVVLKKQKLLLWFSGVNGGPRGGIRPWNWTQLLKGNGPWSPCRNPIRLEKEKPIWVL